MLPDLLRSIITPITTNRHRERKPPVLIVAHFTNIRVKLIKPFPNASGQGINARTERNGNASWMSVCIDANVCNVRNLVQRRNKRPFRTFVVRHWLVLHRGTPIRKWHIAITGITILWAIRHTWM